MIRDGVEVFDAVSGDDAAHPGIRVDVLEMFERGDDHRAGRLAEDPFGRGQLQFAGDDLVVIHGDDRAVGGADGRQGRVAVEDDVVGDAPGDGLGIGPGMLERFLERLILFDGGFERRIVSSGEVGSLWTNVLATRATALINVPVLKDHDLSGVGCGMKNMYGAIHNPNRYHDNNCNPYVADVNAHPFISALPYGYDTILNERGEGLSLGQKQLMVMARTLAQDPELLFVLDEATASVDTATEQLVQDALGKLMHNRTSIVIAHRLSTIRNADCILVMRHGELVDAGTHGELMARDGYYRHLYELLKH